MRAAPLPPRIIKEDNNMEAVKGYDKESYRQRCPVVKEFDSIQNAAEYLAQKYNSTVEKMTDSIMNDTNCDAVYFPDGSVVLCELVE